MLRLSDLFYIERNYIININYKAFHLLFYIVMANKPNKNPMIFPIAVILP